MSLSTAPESFDDTPEITSDQAVAWIMFNSADWGTIYSVGDMYDPSTKTDGIVAVDADVNT